MPGGNGPNWADPGAGGMATGGGDPFGRVGAARRGADGARVIRSVVAARVVTGVAALATGAVAGGGAAGRNHHHSNTAAAMTTTINNNGELRAGRGVPNGVARSGAEPRRRLASDFFSASRISDMDEKRSWRRCLF